MDCSSRAEQIVNHRLQKTENVHIHTHRHTHAHACIHSHTSNFSQLRSYSSYRSGDKGVTAEQVWNNIMAPLESSYLSAFLLCGPQHVTYCGKRPNNPPFIDTPPKVTPRSYDRGARALCDCLKLQRVYL